MRPDLPRAPARGDTEIELQLLDVTDPGIMDKTTQFVKIVLGRLYDPSRVLLSSPITRPRR